MIGYRSETGHKADGENIKSESQGENVKGMRFFKSEGRNKHTIKD